MSITMSHNPDCGTSRNVLALSRNSGAEPKIIEYLKTPPTRGELVGLIDAVMAHPILINRPIVVTHETVKLCRPSETVLDRLPQPPHGPSAKAGGEAVIDAQGNRAPRPQS